MQPVSSLPIQGRSLLPVYVTFQRGDCCFTEKWYSQGTTNTVDQFLKSASMPHASNSGKSVSLDFQKDDGFRL